MRGWVFIISSMLVDLYISLTIKAFDAQHDPVTGCGKITNNYWVLVLLIPLFYPR